MLPSQLFLCRRLEPLGYSIFVPRAGAQGLLTPLSVFREVQKSRLLPVPSHSLRSPALGP